MRVVTDSMVIGLVALRLLGGKTMSRMLESILITFFAFSILAGCSTQSTSTSQTEKTVHYSAGTDPSQAQPPVVTETQTSKTEEASKSETQSGGLLSGTVHVVGEVLALPFRAMAGLINVAF